MAPKMSDRQGLTLDDEKCCAEDEGQAPTLDDQKHGAEDENQQPPTLDDQKCTAEDVVPTGTDVRRSDERGRIWMTSRC